MNVASDDASSPANGERESIRKPAVKDRDSLWLGIGGRVPESLQEAVAQEIKKSRSSSTKSLITSRGWRKIESFQQTDKVSELRAYRFLKTRAFERGFSK